MTTATPPPPASGAAASRCCVHPEGSKHTTTAALTDMTTTATSVYALQTSFFQSGLLLFRANPNLFFSAISALTKEAFAAPLRPASTGPAPAQPPLAAADSPPLPKRPRTEEEEEGSSRSPSPSPSPSPSQSPLPSQQPSLKQKLYELPLAVRSREYYECRKCTERRTENTFRGDPQHAGHEIRWFCPICERLYSVTYRSQHLSKKHFLARRSSLSTASSAPAIATAATATTTTATANSKHSSPVVDVAQSPPPPSSSPLLQLPPPATSPDDPGLLFGIDDGAATFESVLWSSNESVTTFSAVFADNDDDSDL